MDKRAGKNPQPPLPPPPLPSLASTPPPAKCPARKASPPQVYLDCLVASWPQCLERPASPPLPPPTGPKWYFFYGTLTNPKQLQHILGLASVPVLRPATVYGYELATWGEYKALINGKTGQTVDGFAFPVETPEDEAKLARYETKAYQDQACKMHFSDGEEPLTLYGRTFMYAGNAQALKEGKFDRKLWQRTSGVVLPDKWHEQGTSKADK